MNTTRRRYRFDSELETRRPETNRERQRREFLSASSPFEGCDRDGNMIRETLTTKRD
jgi:hypothetical protein